MPRALWVVSIALLSTLRAYGDGGSQTDWTLFPSGGTYTWDGVGTDSLVGTNIGVSSVLGLRTADHNGVTLSVSDGFMNFTSGAYTGTSGSSWKWGAGGTLDVTGCIAGVTSATCSKPSDNVVLLSDDFQSVAIVPLINGGFDVVIGQIQGDVDPVVAAYFGISSTFTATSLNALLSSSTPGHALSGFNLGGMITASPVALAEEWNLSDTLGLFGFAGVIFGAACRLGWLRALRF